ncbi:hypothetical protein E1265_27945 [Streptomyces sp. 8K308]|uniref:hypothetical protein n=1 Tax=Streptomyces sp. 8K308 TaxID=2530388 RepID=UPI00104A1E1F|nr:hypothetical protein [Streptomyces sp. 8K308]TDC13475.1 hypothetical protein E1265_27945 [Streptomyces sp. 8K308]
MNPLALFVAAFDHRVETRPLVDGADLLATAFRDEPGTVLRHHPTRAPEVRIGAGVSGCSAEFVEPLGDPWLWSWAYGVSSPQPGADSEQPSARRD